jgi:GntR family transcriptional regulator/MocR family aminotransferase
MRFATAVDRRSAAPLRLQIYEQWREAVLTGRFRSGTAVPSTRELAATLGVSRSTVTEAYDQLIAEGYLETARGSGTFVCRALPDDLLMAGHRPRPGAREETPVVRLSRYGAGLTEDFRRAPAAPGVIDFRQGSPDLDRFPFSLWRKLLLRQMRHARPAFFDYADQSAGDERLRIEIAAYVARMRAVRCTPDQVIVVNGSQQGFDLSARLLFEPGDEAAFENPGYQGARHAFAARGVRLQPVAVDGDGIVLQGLGRTSRAVYVTPSHQFPTGVSMSLARRLALIEWARQTSAVIIEDDYCSEYRYSGQPLPSLQGLAGGVPVVYLGTFSKVMFPGLRIGYVVAPRQLVPAFTRAKWLTDRQTPILEQATLASFLGEGHLERHIRRMLRLYGLRRQVLVESLSKHFGEDARIAGGAAGMHLMVRFADDRVGARAARNHVRLVGADMYYLTRPPGREFVLGFSALGERTIREGVKRLAG